LNLGIESAGGSEEHGESTSQSLKYSIVTFF
jgi:hypothetical protein